MSFDELEDMMVEELLNPENTTKRRKYNELDTLNPENRHMLVWFRLKHTLGVCSNPGCEDVRPQRAAEGNAMCVVLPQTNSLPSDSSRTACRICYLAGYGLPLAVE